MKTLFTPLALKLLVLILSILLLWNYHFCLWSTVSFNSNCRLSLAESDNFICESNALWNERKYVYQNQDKENMVKRTHHIFFLSNWEPNFHCSHASRIGNMGDGGKWVCDLYRLKSRRDCLIYSAGSHGTFSFETEIKKVMPHCEIHTFDKDFYECPDGICIFHQIMLGDGIKSKGSKSWTMILQELNHTNRQIDIFKIDIEGGEYLFFPQLFKSTKSSFPRQILVEVHPRNPKIIHSFFELLRKNNYVIFNKEPNLRASSKAFEYAFLKLNSRFFDHNNTNRYS
ncbi:unnamed protein product [Rotaria sp. Silwood1]|nr:unnamed protein product [Rotaria sp. Silwood1]CAF3556293.1 unnamed protein product [Rotaria sp. Silwood1]CAF3607600.1 unnamed protein product [Rotaria sp. Silwood1]CAF3668701.1 unnamed protein product [Rotaria sp. Silwood1]CAF4581080.1 unnamed protein product [Rotaria sp. Silwood1]